MSHAGWQPLPPDPTRPSEPHGSTRPTGLVVLFVLIGLMIVGGAGVAAWMVVGASDDAGEFAGGSVVTTGEDGDAPLDEVTRPLASVGVVCEDPGTPAGRGDVAATTTAGLSTDTALSEALASESAYEAEQAIDRLDVDRLAVVACGSSVVLVSGGDAVFALLVGVPPDTVATIDELGLPLVSVAPPSIDDVVRRIERDGEVCPRPGTVTSRELLLADLFTRIAPADGTAPDPRAEAMRAAIDRLPERPVTVRNCTDTQVFGTDGSARVVVLSADSDVTPGDLRALGAVAVVVPA